MIEIRKILILGAASCLSLSGCGINDYIEQKMLEKSGIAEDAEYQDYLKYAEEDRLDDQGYFKEDSVDEDDSNNSSDKLLITFASNEYIDAKYRLNDETEIVDNYCYAQPGDKVYLFAAVNDNTPSSTYELAGYRIYQFSDGARSMIEEVPIVGDQFAWEVPENLECDSISIEPIGGYESKAISLNDYYIDEQGNTNTLNGDWIINEERTTGDSVSINPISSYIVSYEYDSEEYFFMSSEPECFYNNNEDGIVIFPQKEATDEIDNYNVELRKYFDVKISSSLARKVFVDGEETKVTAGDSFIISQLKYGDQLTIETDSVWKELENSKEVIADSAEIGSRGTLYKYTVVVPEKGSEFIFNPKEYKYEHGEVAFSCYGTEITTSIPIVKGRKILYTAKSTEDGYYLNEGSIIVGDETSTRKALEAIHFIKDVSVKVTLPQPLYGGNIEYSIDGKKITTSTIESSSGKKISMKYVPWEGWMLNVTEGHPLSNGDIYEIGENDGQTAFAKGIKEIDDYFVEDPSHKPNFELILDKSLGTNMIVSVSATDMGVKNGSYADNGIFDGTVTLINSKETKIGTQEGIQLSFSNRALESGTAVKINVEKTDKDKKKSTRYLLVDNLGNKIAPIDIYEEGEDRDSKWYQTIKITISIVDVQKFKQLQNISNGKVTVKNSTNQDAMSDGDLIEAGEEVTVKISPDVDYYVCGKKVQEDNSYQSTMKYSKYIQDIQKILDEHPIERFVTLSLQDVDDYGTFTYKLDGKSVSGSVKAKIGQELSVEYNITKPGYVISGAKGVVFDIGKNDQKLEKSLDVTADMQNMTINREAIGIIVVAAEGK